MPIFINYKSNMEKFLMSSLASVVPGFSQDRFFKQLSQRPDEIDSDLAEMLLSLSDFNAFKEMMVSENMGAQCCSMDLTVMHIEK
jgi:ADP-ribosylation factor 2-binding protein